MVKKKNKSLVQPKRVFRMHNSLVITIPIGVRESLKLKVGDYVLFEWKAGGRKASVVKLEGSLFGGRKTSRTGH